MLVQVSELKKGDVFMHEDRKVWTAQRDATTDEDGDVTLRVQYHPDGGLGMRVWEDPTIHLSIDRA